MTTREPESNPGMQRWLILGVIILVLAWILFMKMQEPLSPRPAPPNKAEPVPEQPAKNR
jgi:hypothetical protein